MNPVTEPVKITSLELENVKRIRACAITPTQNGLTVIGGRNNQGKTSVLDAIAWALGGDRHRPSRAAREGSSIPPRLCVKLSNGLVVERTGKNSDLKVTDTEGRRAGQQLLNEFVEQLALDLPMVVEQAVEPPMGKTENPAATVRRRLAEQGRPLMYPKRRTKLELEEMAGTAVAVAVGPEDCLHLRRLMARQNYRPVSGSRRTADRRGKGLLVQMAGRAV